VAAAPPTRREGRLGREGLTRYEASSTPHGQSPQGQRRPTASRVRQEPAEPGHGASVSEGHMQREASPLVDVISMHTIEYIYNYNEVVEIKKDKKALNRA